MGRFRTGLALTTATFSGELEAGFPGAVVAPFCIVLPAAASLFRRGVNPAWLVSLGARRG